MKIYQTENMEHSAKKLVDKFGKAIIFRKYFCKRSIRFRDWLISEIPRTLCNPTKVTFDSQVAKWRKKQGLLHYTPNLVVNKLPFCDALLFTEAPLDYKYFEKYAEKCTDSIVIYRPPNWEFQEEKLALALPDGNKAEALAIAINMLWDHKLTSLELRAANLSNFPNCFEESTLSAITGLVGDQLRKVFTKFGIRSYKWYREYVMHIPPEEEWLLEVYYKLGEELKDGLLFRDVFSYGYMRLQLLIQQGCVSRKGLVFTMMYKPKTLDYNLLNAVTNAKRADWYKMKKIVENAEVY